MKKDFGSVKEGKATLWVMENSSGMKVAVTDYGATVTEIHVKDKNGKLADVVCGFSSVEDYAKKSPYFGCIVGRYGNRIANGSFKLRGKTYQLAKNNEPGGIPCHLHGGKRGFDKQFWKGEEVIFNGNKSLKFTLNSPDGDEGYPGNLNVIVFYTLTDDNALVIDYAG